MYVSFSLAFNIADISYYAIQFGYTKSMPPNLTQESFE